MALPGSHPNITYSPDHVAWIQSELLSALKDVPPNLILNVHIFVTDNKDGITQDGVGIEDPEALDDDTSSDAEKSGHGNENEDNNEKIAKTSNGSQNSGDVLALPMVKTHQGRADLDKFIKDEVAVARDVMSVNGVSASLA